jgi:hypothetical protein
METKYARDHLQIKDKIEQIQKETGGSKCVIASELSKEIKMDPRILRKHLEIMEIDGYGQFRDINKKQIFCTNKKTER